MLAAVGEGGRSKAQEPVLATPTTRSPAFSGGRRLSTGSGSRSFEFPVVKSQSRGASGSEDQGNVEDTSSSKLAKRSGLKIPGTSRLATPSSRAADAEGAGPSEPAAKRSRISPAFQPCSSALKASDLPDYNRILDGDWSELSTTELMGVVLTESCKVVNRKINNLQPRPRPEALVLLKGRLDRAYLKGSMNIELFQESPDDVYLLPQAAYAASALQDGSAHLDEEIAMLARMEAILDDPKEKEVLFKRMGLGEVEPSSGKAEKGKARNNSPVKGVRVQGGSAGGGGGGGTGDKLFDTLTQVFEVLQYQVGLLPLPCLF